MKPIDVAVSRLAARQYSLAHRHQLLDLGMSPRRIQARLNAGWLMPMHQRVYLVGHGASSPEQAVTAAYLATGSEAVASHRCAAALWGLRGVEALEPETTPWADRHRPLRGVVVHRTRELDAVRLDGAYPPFRLGLEADSRIWHGGRLDVQRNSEKANILLAHGWRVLRFTHFDLIRRASYVVDSVGTQLALACPA